MNYHTKRYPITRIVFLFATVAACALFAAWPVVHPVLGNSDKLNAITHIAQGPIGGTVFPIAGQDAEPTEAGLKLRAPDMCEVGELVRFDVSESTVDGITWQILPYTEDFEVIEDGRRAFFSARAESAGGTFLIMVAGAKDGQAFLLHHTIAVAGQPGPPVPETLAIRVTSWAKKVADYEKRKDHAMALAGVFRKLAEADDVKVEQMIEATATANSAILGADLDKWMPFLEALGKELDAYVEADQLTTKEQYKEIWNQIAEGLEKAAQ